MTGEGGAWIPGAKQSAGVLSRSFIHNPKKTPIGVDSMPRKPSLSVVTDDVAPPVPRPKTVRAAAELSSRALLVALRDRIAREIDKGVPPHALAPLSRHLREIAREIEAIDKANHADDIDVAAATPDEGWSG